MEHLPNEILLKIMYPLNQIDLINFGSASINLFHLSRNKHLWKRLALNKWKYWSNYPENKDQDWYQIYKRRSLIDKE